MDDEIEKILEKAKELSQMLKDHSIYKDYRESMEKMEGDRSARDLYAKLTLVGEELNRRMHNGKETSQETRMEYRMLEKELNNTTVVKEYIMNQKRYLDLLKTIIERIKDPIVKSE